MDIWDARFGQIFEQSSWEHNTNLVFFIWRNVRDGGFLTDIFFVWLCYLCLQDILWYVFSFVILCSWFVCMFVEYKTPRVRLELTTYRLTAGRAANCAIQDLQFTKPSVFPGVIFLIVKNVIIAYIWTFPN